jgi:hypothetical protein
MSCLLQLPRLLGCHSSTGKTCPPASVGAEAIGQMRGNGSHQLDSLKRWVPSEFINAPAHGK